MIGIDRRTEGGRMSSWPLEQAKSLHTCFSGNRKEALEYLNRQGCMSRPATRSTTAGTAASSSVVPHVLSISRSANTNRLDSDSTYAS